MLIKSCPGCTEKSNLPHTFDKGCFAPYGAVKNEVHRLQKELNIALLKVKEGDRIIPADATSQEN